jgi:hypothetical protein
MESVPFFSEKHHIDRQIPKPHTYSFVAFLDQNVSILGFKKKIYISKESLLDSGHNTKKKRVETR